MIWGRHLLATAALATGGLAIAAPAQAAVNFGMLPAAFALTLPQVAAAPLQRCEPGLAPAGGEFAQAPAAAQTKAAAILGGQVSQLELIARQQAGQTEPQVAGASPAPVIGEGLTPASGSFGCAGLAAARPALAAIAPGRRTLTPLGSDDFLASKRLTVSRTSFDGAWNRVRGENLPRGLAASLTEATSTQPGMAKLAAVNSWANANIRYADDSKLYGQRDFWASAGSTLKRRAGDCEDIAIVKMQLLAAMGVRREDMTLTIARDLARNADHALLVVKIDGRNWLLDNNTDVVLEANQAYDYRPVLSFSTSQKWLHGY
jgi:predicted transglutaminase-like cysteine proteinase